MNAYIELPQYDNETLATYREEELIEVIIQNEDRVPRNVIDECARRGDTMLETLTPYAKPNDEREDKIGGYWWLRLHAINILGLIAGEKAGLLLVEYIRNMCREEDSDLQGWLPGYWPALMDNKPAAIITLIRDMSMDKNIDWFMRTNLTDAVIADAVKQGAQALDAALDWVAAMIADDQDDWDYQLCTANTILLGFPRERHRELINSLADEQASLGTYFTKSEVSRVFENKQDKPEWIKFGNPWSIYEPEQIESRQRRWQEEASIRKLHTEENDALLNDILLNDLLHNEEDYHFQETYRRETPKIGRNDPCHCGSRKKYKKCCLNKDQKKLP